MTAGKGCMMDVQGKMDIWLYLKEKNAGLVRSPDVLGLRTEPLGPGICTNNVNMSSILRHRYINI